ncbi:hypothetical protein HC256_000652 [Beauveria bassiana]|nr:hypothetical protein HC256_000652 [Beauveria bassiana]
MTGLFDTGRCHRVQKRNRIIHAGRRIEPVPSTRILSPGHLCPEPSQSITQTTTILHQHQRIIDAVLEQHRRVGQDTAAVVAAVLRHAWLLQPQHLTHARERPPGKGTAGRESHKRTQRRRLGHEDVEVEKGVHARGSAHADAGEDDAVPAPAQRGRLLCEDPRNLGNHCPEPIELQLLAGGKVARVPDVEPLRPGLAPRARAAAQRRLRKDPAKVGKRAQEGLAVRGAGVGKGRDEAGGVVAAAVEKDDGVRVGAARRRQPGDLDRADHGLVSLC